MNLLKLEDECNIAAGEVVTMDPGSSSIFKPKVCTFEKDVNLFEEIEDLQFMLVTNERHTWRELYDMDPFTILRILLRDKDFLKESYYSASRSINIAAILTNLKERREYYGFYMPK